MRDDAWSRDCTEAEAKFWIKYEKEMTKRKIAFGLLLVAMAVIVTLVPFALDFSYDTTYNVIGG